MLNIEEARKIVKKNFPRGKIEKYIECNDLFVFLITTDDPLEGGFDPFYSVHRKTGIFQGFPMMLPENFKVASELFLKSSKK